MQLDKFKNIKIKKTIYKGFLIFLVSSVSSVLLLSFIPVIATPLMFIRSYEQLKDPEIDFKWKRDWVSLDEISDNMVDAVMSSEDQNFMVHNGFDFDAIEKAMQHNKVSKKKIGASTISQQTAKNVFLWPGRNWLRKGLEAYFTLLIETIWSKDRIMETYLNVVELGHGIYGVEAASEYYYHKPASDLNRQEAAMLAAILPNPRKYKPNTPSKYLKNRQQRIVRQMTYIRSLDNNPSYTAN